MVCLIYLLPLAGDIELNPGPVASYLENVHPVPKEPVSPIPKTGFFRAVVHEFQ